MHTQTHMWSHSGTCVCERKRLHKFDCKHSVYIGLYWAHPCSQMHLLQQDASYTHTHTHTHTPTHTNHWPTDAVLVHGLQDWVVFRHIWSERFWFPVRYQLFLFLHVNRQRQFALTMVVPFPATFTLTWQQSVTISVLPFPVCHYISSPFSGLSLYQFSLFRSVTISVLPFPVCHYFSSPFSSLSLYQSPFSSLSLYQFSLFHLHGFVGKHLTRKQEIGNHSLPSMISMPVTLELVLWWLPCPMPSAIGSVQGLVGPVSVYCDYVTTSLICNFNSSVVACSIV